MAVQSSVFIKKYTLLNNLLKIKKALEACGTDLIIDSRNFITALYLSRQFYIEVKKMYIVILMPHAGIYEAR